MPRIIDEPSFIGEAQLLDLSRQLAERVDEGARAAFYGTSPVTLSTSSAIGWEHFPNISENQTLTINGGESSVEQLKISVVAALRGRQADEKTKIVVCPELYYELLKSDIFAKYIVYPLDGSVGTFMGIPVFVSDKIPKTIKEISFQDYLNDKSLHGR